MPSAVSWRRNSVRPMPWSRKSRSRTSPRARAWTWRWIPRACPRLVSPRCARPRPGARCASWAREATSPSTLARTCCASSSPSSARGPSARWGSSSARASRSTTASTSTRCSRTAGSSSRPTRPTAFSTPSRPARASSFSNQEEQMKLFVGIALALAVFSVGAQTKLRYAHVGVANAPQTLYADEVAKLVKERTNGRIEIQVFANSQLGGVNEMVDGVRSGAIAIGHHDFGSLGRIVANTAVFNTPFMYRDPEHAMRATDPKLSPALREINQELVQKGNMRIVAALFQGTRQLTSKEKVLSVKDMQGKKYRGVPIKLWSSMLTGMGAVATPVEVSELATALATGLVVGQENPLPNIYNLKLYEVQKYMMLTGHMQSILSVFINEGVYQRLPAADRKILESTMIEVGKKSVDWDRETAAKYRKDLEAKGMVFVEQKDGLDVEGFRKSVLAQVNKDFPEWGKYIEQIRAVK